MRYLSVCSGIEAATQAWRPLGWRAVAFSEVDKFPSAVLAHHYPTVPNWGNMRKFQEWPDAAVDVLVGGTPCQSFSVAGLRKGLADPRGNLMLTYLAIAARYRPQWVVWENVPGVLSSHGGRDFGTFLGALGELGYGFAYRVLDAQYVRVRGLPRAVPQRRRRVFVVGYLGDWRRAAAVLFDAESLRGDTPPRREAGKSIAPTLSARPSGGGGLGTDFDLDGGVILSHDPDCTLTAREYKGALPEADLSTVVAHSLRGEGFDASEDGTGRGTPLVPVAVAPTLRAGGNATGGDRPYGTDVDTCDSLVPVAIQERAISENPDAGPDGVGVRQDGAAYTLEARQVPQAVAFDPNQITNPHNQSRPDPAVHHTLPATSKPPYLAHAVSYRTAGDGAVFEEGNVTAPLTTGTDPSAQIVAFSAKDDGGDAMIGVSPTLRAGGFDASHANGGVMPAVAVAWQVRRLTPRECERLQGFPDDFTRIPYRRKSAEACPDGPRYKALGNSMAVNVMEYIGERIALVDSLIKEQQRSIA